MASLKQLSNEWYLATALYDAIDDENLRAITSLVQERNANANVIIPDYGYTPLHLAVGHENEKFGQEVTKLLMSNGGDPNVRGVDGVTPLHVAVAWNRSVVSQLLLSYGADPWMKDDSEKDAFDIAQEQQAWDTFRALEAFRHSKHENKYKIKLDKVIIHSNDVQAEYRAISEPCTDGQTPKNKQSVSTQTPRPFVRSPLTDTDEMLTEDMETHSSGTSRGFDRRYDWCDKSDGVVLTEECKRTIYRHRARSSLFEYSPRRSAKDSTPESHTKIQEARKRFFPPVCCVANDLSFTDDSLSKDLDEKKAEKTADYVNVPVKARYDNEGVFSDDSLMTDDRSSDSKSTPGKWNLMSIAEDIPYIDETTSCTNASQNSDTNIDPKRMVNANHEDIQIVASNELQKETVKHVSWPDCISACACIPSHEDDDSFTVYSSSQETAKKLSGAEALPDKKTKDDHRATEVSFEYKITDDEDGIEFIAARMPLSNSDSVNANTQSSPEESANEPQCMCLDLSSPSAYAVSYIRKELEKLGFASGPIVGTQTKRLYLRKLKRLKKTVSSPMKHFLKLPAFSSELEQVLSSDDPNWLETLNKWSNLEKIMRDHFENASRASTWRAGTAKTSFVYLLLDPRISNNLPSRCFDNDLINVWQTFVRAVFYIGKGTRARPYEHLQEALEIWHNKRPNVRNLSNKKISQILEIWKEGLGVVCVQTFHNVIPAEAFTREAAMIDAIGLTRLKNEKSGVYYGEIAKWNAKLKRRLGVTLLFRAMRTFITDNEIQLKPTDVN